jgi:hypothetical protein
MIRGVEDLPPVEGFERGDVRDYGAPELGWSVPYRTGGGLTATVYIYPVPVNSKPNDAGPTEFARSVDEIRSSVSRGAYREVTTLGKSPARITLSAIHPRAHHQSFLLRTDTGSIFSELVLLDGGPQVIKIRASYPPFPPVQERQQGRDLQMLFMAILQGSGATSGTSP